MDPQATARELVSLSRMLLEIYDRDEPFDDDDVDRLVHLLLAFADWRARGGFDADWQAALGKD